MLHMFLFYWRAQELSAFVCNLLSDSQVEEMKAVCWSECNALRVWPLLPCDDPGVSHFSSSRKTPSAHCALPLRFLYRSWWVGSVKGGRVQTQGSQREQAQGPSGMVSLWRNVTSTFFSLCSCSHPAQYPHKTLCRDVDFISTAETAEELTMDKSKGEWAQGRVSESEDEREKVQDKYSIILRQTGVAHSSG